MPMGKLIRIGTRESHLAIWQAKEVQGLLVEKGHETELVYIKSEGDLDQKTPLYALGVQGIFTRSLDLALLAGKIDLAVHSMKDVPVKLAEGIIQAAVLKRGSVRDLLVYKGEWSHLQSVLSVPENRHGSASVSQVSEFRVATGSIRRRAQWLNRYPSHQMEDLRGNIDSRLNKLENQNWDAAIFAQAGLQRIGLQPIHSQVLDWMLPAPAQGAILVVCMGEDEETYLACQSFHDPSSALCTQIERDFLSTLQGGCSTPIGALAESEQDEIYFRGNLLSPDGKKKFEIERVLPLEKAKDLGLYAGEDLLRQGGKEISSLINYEKE
jgi:hydroxymethylbilane synthase